MIDRDKWLDAEFDRLRADLRKRRRVLIITGAPLAAILFCAALVIGPLSDRAIAAPVAAVLGAMAAYVAVRTRDMWKEKD